MANLKKYFYTTGIFFTLIFGACGNSSVPESQPTDATHAELVSNTGYTSETQMADKKFTNVSQTTQKHINDLVNHYSELKNALVEGSATKAASSSEMIISEINNFKKKNGLTEEQEAFYIKAGAKLKNNAERISKSKDIDEQRNSFASLTEETYKLVKAFGGNEQDVYYQYCPMAFDNTGGYWLSLKKEIRNPYFGDKMLKCGVVKETISVSK